MFNLPWMLKAPVENTEKYKNANVDTCVILAKHGEQQLGDEGTKNIGHCETKRQANDTSYQCVL